MSWQTWLVLAAVLAVMAIATGVSAIDAANPWRARTAFGFMALAGFACVVSAQVAWPA